MPRLTLKNPFCGPPTTYTAPQPIPRDLTTKTLNPSPAPKIDIILVVGDTSAYTNILCAQFAHDFGFEYLNVQAYLRQLAQDGALGGKSDGPLGLLDQGMLRGLLERWEAVEAFFVVEILRLWVEGCVRRGGERFLISGLDGEEESVDGFARTVAEPVALIAFRDQLEERSLWPTHHRGGDKWRDAVERWFSKAVVEIDVDVKECVDLTYLKLLAKMFERVAAAC